MSGALCAGAVGTSVSYR
ncbi:unnamed protein product, partial [Didymodactylos carnosus]